MIAAFAPRSPITSSDFSPPSVNDTVPVGTGEHVRERLDDWRRVEFALREMVAEP